MVGGRAPKHLPVLYAPVERWLIQPKRLRLRFHIKKYYCVQNVERSTLAMTAKGQKVAMTARNKIFKKCEQFKRI